MAQRIVRGPVPLEEALATALQICEALEVRVAGSKHRFLVRQPLAADDASSSTSQAILDREALVE